MQANLDAISFSLSELDPKSIAQRLKEARSNPDGIIPLADVPDLVWKNLPNKVVGGRDDHMVGYRSQGPEHPCHYADIDEPGPDGSIVRDLCLQDIANLTVTKWQQFYDERGHRTPDKRGLLPFRVWQFYDAMVGFAKVGRSTSSFVRQVYWRTTWATPRNRCTAVTWQTDIRTEREPVSTRATSQR